MFKPDDNVKTCRRLESGLRLGPDAIRACCLGPIVSPPYWSAEEARELRITKAMIVEKRRQLFEMLNDNHSDVSCKRCMSVERKLYRDVRFDRLGHINLSHFSMCNLRCYFCGYALHNDFLPPQYDALAILKEFNQSDIEWDSYVDLNGGEPTLLKNLKEYLEYFDNRKVRVLIYTNAVIFSELIYYGLSTGSIQWAIVSLDAGIPSTFKKLKGKDYFKQVIENIARYAHAGSQGMGMLAVKYVFCAPNCGNDDISAFAYAMMAIRPQKIWLTIDFLPLCDKYEDQEAVGIYDYSMHIDSYAKLYLTLKQHGLEAVHFSELHLAEVLKEGKDIFHQISKRIQDISHQYVADDLPLILHDFRQNNSSPATRTVRFNYRPLVINREGDRSEPWTLKGKRIQIAPVWRHATDLVSDPEIREGILTGFLDRSPVLGGKVIHGLEVRGYDTLSPYAADVILVDAPDQHRNDIIHEIACRAGQDTLIAVLDR